MNIAVIGGGSVGLLVSYYLAECNDITLYVRRESQKSCINTKQMELITNEVTHRTSNVIAKLIKEIDLDHDLYIVCVKQTQIKSVMESLEHNSSTSRLLFLQNGMGHIAELQSISQDVYVGIVSHGAHRISCNQVHHLGNGSIKIASLKNHTADLTQLQHKLHAANFPVEETSNWERLLKEKLIVNAVINPLTALFNVPNGEIVTNSYLNKLAKAICKESATVLNLQFNESWDNVMKTAKITKNNISSMRADIIAKRRTEIEAITGYIIQEAKIDVPYSTFVYYAILSLDQERTSS